MLYTVEQFIVGHATIGAVGIAKVVQQVGHEGEEDVILLLL